MFCHSCGLECDVNDRFCNGCGTPMVPADSNSTLSSQGKDSEQVFVVNSGISLISTSQILDGISINAYKGIVCGEAILGMNMFKDVFANVRDIVGGRSGAYEGELRKAREIAINEMSSSAQQLGANAVVGVSVSYQSLGQTNGMLMVAVTGTAVSIEYGKQILV